jgi:hypothetical protein
LALVFRPLWRSGLASSNKGESTWTGDEIEERDRALVAFALL